MNQPTIPRIKRAVAEGFEVSVEDIDSRIKKQPIAVARQTVYYYVRKLLRMPYMEMERKLDRDHANFIHAVKTIENLRECDIETRAVIEGLESEFPWLRGEEVEVKA